MVLSVASAVESWTTYFGTKPQLNYSSIFPAFNHDCSSNSNPYPIWPPVSYYPFEASVECQQLGRRLKLFLMILRWVFGAMIEVSLMTTPTLGHQSRDLTSSKLVMGPDLLHSYPMVGYEFLASFLLDNRSLKGAYYVCIAFQPSCPQIRSPQRPASSKLVHPPGPVKLNRHSAWG